MSAIYENSSAQTDEGVTETVNTETTHTLCENTDCERYPDDEDFDKDNEEEYEENGEWKKCALCDGYFVDNGFNDLLFISEEPNKKEAQCDLCGKTNDIVQMKGTGECLCGNGCDASDDDWETGETDDDWDSNLDKLVEKVGDKLEKHEIDKHEIDNYEDTLDQENKAEQEKMKKLCLERARKEEDDADDAEGAEEDAYMEEVKKLQKKYNIKTDKDGVIILPMGSAD